MHLPSYLIFCIFASILAVVRIFITGTTDLAGLVWNLILAFLPYIFALAYTSCKGKIKWFAFFLWLAFLPNSFYILTDFVHLPEHPELVYFDTVYIMAMTLAGMISGYASMELIHREWNIHYHKRLAWFFMIVVTTLSMFGIYIGRFLRFNSWDIVANPLQIVHEVWALVVSNGSVLNIVDSFRFSESQKFTTGMMGLWQFMLLYGIFFFLGYVYLYHAKKK